jgi:curved DNA-binding protein CbpA
VNQTSSESREASFEVLANVDITKLPLTPEEGFVVSRLIGRRRGLTDIANETGLPPGEVKRHLDSLVRKGAVAMVARPKTDAEREVTNPKGRLPYDGMVFSPGDLADGPDLSDEQKRRILYVDANLGVWNHYKLLGIKRTASAVDVKAAYFKVSKEFHPDAFFRKNLGRHAERIDRIFRAMKAAYDVLSRHDVRSAYDDTLVADFSPEELAELEAIADLKKREIERAARLARNDAARKAARLKWNPLAQRLARGAELFALAEAARKAGKLDEAVTQARLACSFDESLNIRAEAIYAEAEAARAQTMFKRLQHGVQFIDKDNQEDVLKAAELVAEQAEKLRKPAFLVDVAQTMVMLKRPQKAFRLANLATELDPQLTAAWTIVAELAAQEGKWALAQRAADRWQTLDPKAVRPKELLKQAKAR